METRICRKCGENKCITEYYSDSRYKDGDIHCKECRKAKVKAWRVVNLQRARQQAKERHKNNPFPARNRAQQWHINNRDKHLAYMRKRREEQPDHMLSIKLKSTFGITYEEYLKILESQNGVCAICGKTPQQNKKRLAVDHCHETQKIRGLLCSVCNKALGLMKDSIDNLFSAIAYLNYHNEQPTSDTTRAEDISPQNHGRQAACRPCAPIDDTKKHSV